MYLFVRRTQTAPPPIVLKLKKYDDHNPDVINPHTFHISTETIDRGQSNSSSFIQNNERDSAIMTTSPGTLRVKLNTPFLNGCGADHIDEEYAELITLERVTRPAKRTQKSLSSDNASNNILNTDLNNDYVSSQQDKRITDVQQDHCIASESTLISPLVLKIRPDSLTLTTTNSSNGIPSIVESESNRQLLIKLKKNENGELLTRKNSFGSQMSTEYLINEQQNCSTANELASTILTNGHTDSLYKPVTIQSSPTPHVTNMLLNFNNDDNKQKSQQKPVLDQTSETHTKELLDEALDSVKNVLMQTFKKNLESGGDLNALKSTLGSDEVAEVFLAKLRQSLKRDTENESKSQDRINTSTEISSSQTSTPLNSSNTMMSPISNVTSSPLLPSIPTMMDKTSSPSSPQSQITNVNNKRKASTVSMNPNRFDGATEEELSQRLLSDILQPNLDIVFVGVNPSLYAVHKGHHYGGPGNHFWKLLHMSGLIPNSLNANDDYRMPQYGIGFTNIVQRPSKAGSDITKDEITAGAEVLMHKIKTYRPKIVAFNGRGIYEVYAGNKHFHYGKQPELFLGTDTHVFVMPSSSARCSQLPRAEDKLPFYVGLRKLRDFVNGSLHSLNEAEITFPDIKIKDTDDVLQKTVIRISNKPFSELSAETLKCYGDKIPSGQMISKNIQSSSSQQINYPSPSLSPSSSSNLVFNTDAITTQTMSILHNTNHLHNENLITYDQQAQRVYLQNNGSYASSPPQFTNQQQRSSTNSYLDNLSSNTNAAVLAALASGGFNSSTSQPTQTIFTGGQHPEQQSGSYSTSSSFNNNSTISNSRSSLTPSYLVHHTPQSSVDYQNSSTSQIISRSLHGNSTEPLPSFDTLLNSSSLSIRSQTISTKDSLSSHQYLQKQTLIVVPSTMKSGSSCQLPSTSTNSSTIVLPKISHTNSIEKRPRNTTDDCLYVRYESEPHTSNNDQFRFSYIVDEHSPLLHKRLRYVSINDL
ncbi:unnamed protein product [Rotaria magnacalcarata]|uniref:G/T mismatch-specific thymine DNA glycosylase n=8 Tax=Rotaria magnacalcarata TaxID=392030 RepID=A0A819FYF6_9BILA|nr:unnamed protein product [Rotaria magnacalcarata]CAF3876232.1 unnamed protein product [Rotaria magnacalcarata]